MAETNSIRSQSPYFDDFDPSKDYLQVLFRPGYPVQARELTTLQSFVQEQLKRLGETFYREGTIIKGAEVTLSKDVYSLALLGTGSSNYPSSGATVTNLATIANLEGKVITNSDGTVKARVISSPTGVSTETSIGTVYIQYITAATFSENGDYIYALTGDNSDQLVSYYNTYETTGLATLASCEAGIYFIAGKFINVAEQTIVVSTSTHKPSLNVGLQIIESAISQNEDSSLYDNARGSTNEGAPGAHRLLKTATLSYKTLAAALDTTFYRIATFYDGVQQELNEVSTAFNMLNDTLARRTYDESGDYALKPFMPSLSALDSEEKFEVVVSPSKAYVKGYEITKNYPTRIELDGVSGSKVVRKYSSPVVGTTSVHVTNVINELPGSEAGSGAVFNPSNRILLENATDVIGIARAWGLMNEGSIQELYLYDIRMFTGLTMDPSNGGGFVQSLETGNDVHTNRATGYVFSEEGVPGGHELTIINATGTFKAGQAIVSTVQSDSDAIIASVTSYSLADVTRVSAANGFSASVTANSINNIDASLIAPIAKTLKTLKSSSTSVLGNTFEVLEDTGAATGLNAANGYFDKADVYNAVEIEKTLRFGYIKVPASQSVNYGWSALHREVTLLYPDIYKVYQVNETADNTFDYGHFPRLSISTAGVIPQGSIIIGNTSGSKAIVALANASTLSETTVGSALNRVGTASASTIEIIFTRGQTFSIGETLTVQTPGSEPEYNYSVSITGMSSNLGSDITASYLLDDGQRRDYYDIGRLVRKSNTPAPNQDILVFFSYFEADPTTNHYYSVDSYAGEDFYRVDPRWIEGNREIKPLKGTEGVQLRNAIDFRLRVRPITDTTVSPFNFANRTFFEQDRIMPDSQFNTDLEEYVGRVDLVSLQKTGEMIVIPGVPSANPRKPLINQDGMPLFYLSVAPVVRYPQYDVVVEKLDNRRYTMRDIGNIERRLEKVEEVVVLNNLEVQALNDDVDGMTKSGFVVSSFSSLADDAIDYDHTEFNASIDVVNKNLIPAQTDGVQVPMFVNATSGISTFFDDYILNDFTEDPFISQTYATTSEVVNKWGLWSYTADVTLDPPADHWRIRKDDYFTNIYGELKPFDSTPSDFRKFNNIHVPFKGGRTAALYQWLGVPVEEVTSTTANSTTYQAKRNASSTIVGKANLDGDATTTATGATVVQKPQDYWMRSIDVNYTGSNFKASTEHRVIFGKSTVATVTSDEKGDISGTFTIPAQTYAAGTETVIITDSEGSSYGVTSFESKGHVDAFEAKSKIDTNIANPATGATISVGGSVATDPIAQIFKMENAANGVQQTSILTSVDLWLGAVDTNSSLNKVKVEIREVVDGFPGGVDKVLGETAYLEVTASNVASTPLSSNSINLKFKEPLVLRNGSEYAMVVMTPSSKIKMFIAEVGENTIDGAATYSSQPNIGGSKASFFKLQGNKSWSPYTSRDLTFRINRAKFDVSATGTYELLNIISDSESYVGDVGAYAEGLAFETFANSNYVRVYHPNHGLQHDIAETEISGLDSDTYNGIKTIDIRGSHLVKYPTLNTYMIDAGRKATASGFINTGRFNTFATQNIVFDSMVTNFKVRKEESDEVSMTVRTSSTNTMNMIVANNKVYDEDVASVVVGTDDAYSVDRLIEFDSPKVIRSKTNGLTNQDLRIRLNLSSSTEFTSPIIKKDSNLYPIVFRNLTGTSIEDSDIESLTRTYIDSDGYTDDQIQEYVSYLQGVQSETEHSAYVTKQVDLEIPASDIVVKLDADMAPGSAVKLAYKARAIGDNTPFEELEWVTFNTDQHIDENNYSAFNSDASVKSYTAKVAVPYDFSAFKVRIRMETQNEAQVPKVSNLRVLAVI